MKSSDLITLSWWLCVICIYCDALSHTKHDGIGHTQYFQLSDTEAAETSTLELLRQKRSAEVDVAGQSLPTEDDSITTVVELNDTHHSGLIHWAGDGSDLVICLTRDMVVTPGRPSGVFVSLDYGRSFSNVSGNFVLEDGSPAIISRFFEHPQFNDIYVFIDKIHKQVFVTDDVSAGVTRHAVDFVPSKISFDPHRRSVLLAYDENTQSLWASDTVGASWHVVDQYVASYTWDARADPSILYVLRRQPKGGGVVRASSGLFTNYTVLLDNVEKFTVEEDFRFAVRRLHLLGSHHPEGSLQLWISHRGGEFQRALFPAGLAAIDFEVVDVSDEQVMVSVTHNATSSSLYVSTVPDSRGVRFSLSLENVLTHSTGKTFVGGWLSMVGGSFVDVHHISGLRGIYLASQIPAGLAGGRLAPEHVRTLITFDKGGQWRPVTPPTVDNYGVPIDCRPADNCSLHISQEMATLYPATKYVPVLSSPSAVGLVMATGVVGSSLKGHPSVMLSRDAGVTWKQVLRGQYLYAFADHGGLVVAVSSYQGSSSGGTRELLYSLDEGMTWRRHFFFPEAVRVYSLLTEPGEGSTVFLVFCARLDRHGWISVRVDLRSQFKHNCTVDDYKLWTPRERVSGRSCLLGRRNTYHRRQPHAYCYSGERGSPLVSTENCDCLREDYQCDYGYKEEVQSFNCVRDPEVAALPSSYDPRSCPAGGYYNVSRGYARVPGDTCVPGPAATVLYEPERRPCPLNESSDFILIARRDSILQLSLSDVESDVPPLALPLSDVASVVALEYDIRRNCLVWSDTILKRVLRQCMDGSEREVLLSHNSSTVEALVLDWTTGNLYLTESTTASIQLVRPDVPHAGHLRTTLLGDRQLDNPRGLALHPPKGYMFWTDWSQTRPGIYRAFMDGTKHERIIGQGKVTWPNGICVDYAEDKLYWVDANLNYVASANLDGQNMQYLLKNTEHSQHPFSISVYKDLMLWNDWLSKAVLMTDKRSPERVLPVMQDADHVVTIKVYGQLSQQGVSGCTNNTACRWICTPRPAGGHQCLCPDGLRSQEDKCVCPDGSTPLENATCPQVNHTCSPEFFACATNKICINRDWLCDGDNDCGDLSDEANCQQTPCREFQFRCDVVRCITASWRCDFETDCADGSDERGCVYPNCTDGQFRCSSGRCVRGQYRCDGDDDCGDGSDESGCPGPTAPPCAAGAFACADSQRCLPSSWVCDGTAECPNGDDEDPVMCTNHTCPAYRFQCASKRCIPMKWRCDAENDCGDGSDELNCDAVPTTAAPSTLAPPTFPSENCDPRGHMLRCANDRCIPVWWKCDGSDDCGDGSDEAGCADDAPPTPSTAPGVTTDPPLPHTCPFMHFRCSSGKCIWESWVCDGDRDCPGGDDEEECGAGAACSGDSVHCLLSGECIAREKRCDGRQDCADNSDEEDCTTDSGTTPPQFTCPSGFFRCDFHTCLPYHKYCDGRRDCVDGYDEATCRDDGVVLQVVSFSADRKKLTSHSVTVRWRTNARGPQMLTRLQYLPSICAVYQPGQCHWVNMTTWLSDAEYTFEQLEPYTWYNITVYVREEGRQQPYPPSQYFSMRTLSAQPSPPWRVNATQLNHKAVLVTWLAPKHLNGPLISYRLSVTPPVRPLTFITRHTNYTVIEDFVPGRNYVFSVQAENSGFLSQASHASSLVFDSSAVIGEVTELELQPAATAAALQWRHPDGAEGVRVRCVPAANRLVPMQQLSTEDDEAVLSGLSPGTEYVLSLRGYNGRFSGQVLAKAFTTLGTQLPAPANLTAQLSPHSGTLVNLSWQAAPLDDGPLEYGVFYGTSTEEMYEAGVRQRTKETRAEVSRLAACEDFLLTVAVVGPAGVGAGAPLQRVRTSYSIRAAPKNVTVEAVRGQRLQMAVSWSASCAVVQTRVGYNITVEELGVDMAARYTLVNVSTETWLRQLLPASYGGHYRVTVSTTAVGAVPAAAVLFAAPPIPAPRQLRPIVQENGTVLLFWKRRRLPPDMRDVKYTYLVHVAPTLAGVWNSSGVPAAQERFSASHLKADTTYYAAVQLVTTDGYRSQLSQAQSFHVPPDDSVVVVAKHHLVAVVVPVVLLVLLVLVVSAVVVYRHHRLRSMFRTFVSTHYSARPAAARFTSGEGLEDDDAPIIRGFADDEPLVVA